MSKMKLRYSISSWKQAENCLSNNSKYLYIEVKQFIQNNEIVGQAVYVKHAQFGTLFGAVTSASGSIISTSKDSGEDLLFMTTSEILDQLEKFGFIITYRKEASLSDSQLDYLSKLLALGYDKITKLVVDSTNEVVVAFNSLKFIYWTNFGARITNEALGAQCLQGNAFAITLTDSSFDWDWLIYACGIQDIIDGNSNEPTPEPPEPDKPIEVKTISEIKSKIAELTEGQSLSLKLVDSVVATPDDLITISNNINFSLELDADIFTQYQLFDICGNSTVTLLGNGNVRASMLDNSASLVVCSGNDTVLNINGGNYSAYSDAPLIEAKSGADINIFDGIFTSSTQVIDIPFDSNPYVSTIYIENGNLFSCKNYAIFSDNYAKLSISGGSVCGMNIHSGNIKLSGSATILPPGINEYNTQSIGTVFDSQQCETLGDTIAVIAGNSISKENNSELSLTLIDNARVYATERNAIGIYQCDMFDNNECKINILASDQIYSAATGRINNPPVRVYDHSYISEEASASGKEYNPSYISDIDVIVGGKHINI